MDFSVVKLLRNDVLGHFEALAEEFWNFFYHFVTSPFLLEPDTVKKGTTM